MRSQGYKLVRQSQTDNQEVVAKNIEMNLTRRTFFLSTTAMVALPTLPSFAEFTASDEQVKIFCGGIILPPEMVRRIGSGNLNKGHEVLNHWILDMRKDKYH